jgi:hypothetical protein
MTVHIIPDNATVIVQVPANLGEAAIHKEQNRVTRTALKLEAPIKVLVVSGGPDTAGSSDLDDEIIQLSGANAEA